MDTVDTSYFTQNIALPVLVTTQKFAYSDTLCRNHKPYFGGKISLYNVLPLHEIGMELTFILPQCKSQDRFAVSGKCQGPYY